MKSRQKLDLRPQAFSIPELLICIGVLAVVLSLAVPAMSASRKRAIELRCLTHVNQLGTLVAMYNHSAQDLFPAYVPAWTGPVEARLERALWLDQSRQAWQFDPWVSFVGYDPLQKPDFYRCFDHTPRKNSTFTRNGIDMQLARSLYLDPQSLSSDPETRERFRFREGAVQRSGDALYPSQKVGITEVQVWHNFGAVIPEVTDVDELFMYKTRGRFAINLLDGSGRLVLPAEITPAESDIPNMINGIISATPDGIRGRDLKQ